MLEKNKEILDSRLRASVCNSQLVLPVFIVEQDLVGVSAVMVRLCVVFKLSGQILSV